MFRFRTVAAGALLLFGTTFLWFMPSFLGTGTTVDGAMWSVIQLLVLATVVGYAGAAWGLYKATTWWRPLAIGGSILGALVLVLLVPSLGRGIDRRLAGHSRLGTCTTPAGAGSPWLGWPAGPGCWPST
jgi:hypothetical protein